MRSWWHRHGEGVEEDLRKVAYLQGQLDNALRSLSSSLDELRDILEPPDEDGQEGANA